MKRIAFAESFKDCEKNFNPYYIKEIVPYAVQRKSFEPEDVGRLGTPATHLGVEKIRAKTSIGKYIADFLNKATIHGLNHLAAPRRHFFERILTVLCLSVALAGSIVSSLNSWQQYQTNATAMVLDVSFKNFTVTKPAITVCLHEKVLTTNFSSVFKKYGVEDTPKARDFFTFISNANYSTLSQTPIYSDTSPDKWLGIIHDLYIGLEPDHCDDPAAGCPRYAVPTIDIVTEKGICTTVHAIGSQITGPFYLRRSYHSGHFIDKMRGLCFGIFPDHMKKISLHYPNELPVHGGFWSQHRENAMTVVQIAVHEIESSDDLRELSERQRPCNFPEDGSLEMWPVYTRNMCLLECRYNFFKWKCGCYPHFARPMPGTQICNATQLRCVGNISKFLVSEEGENVHSCDCKYNCATVKYEIISTETTGYNDFLGSQVQAGMNTRPLGVDVLYPFHKFRHEVFFGFKEFLVGGGAGLFLGASIISFIEILYYITLRLILWHKNNIHEQREE